MNRGRIINTPYGVIHENDLPIVEAESPLYKYGRMVLFGLMIITVLIAVLYFIINHFKKDDFTVNGLNDSEMGFNNDPFTSEKFSGYYPYQTFPEGNDVAWGEGRLASKISKSISSIYISNIEIELPLKQVELITRDGGIYNVDVERDLFVNKLPMKDGGLKFEIILPQKLNVMEITLQFDPKLLYVNDTLYNNKIPHKGLIRPTSGENKTVKLELYDSEKNKIWETYEFLGDYKTKSIKLFKEKKYPNEYYNSIMDHPNEENFLYNYISNLN